MAFAVEADPARRSHRSPRPRFQPDFDRASGVLYHLGNPDLKETPSGRCFFAYELLSEASKNAEFLEFAPEYRVGVESFLESLMAESPVRELIFTSDWQFGPEWTQREPPLGMEEFWRLHDRRELKLNALYSIRG
jgi:hypothetical protein